MPRSASVVPMASAIPRVEPCLVAYVTRTVMSIASRGRSCAYEGLGRPREPDDAGDDARAQTPTREQPWVEEQRHESDRDACGDHGHRPPPVCEADEPEGPDDEQCRRDHRE